MKEYTHYFTIGFCVLSHLEDKESIPEGAITSALLSRIGFLIENNRLTEATDVFDMGMEIETKDELLGDLDNPCD